MLNDDLCTYLYHYCNWRDMHTLSLVNKQFATHAAYGRMYVTQTWLPTASEEERKAILSHQPIPRTALIRHVWWGPCLLALNEETRLTEADKCHFFHLFQTWKTYGIVPPLRTRAWLTHVLDDVLYAPAVYTQPPAPCLYEVLRLPQSRLRFQTFHFDGFVLKDHVNRIYGLLTPQGLVGTGRKAPTLMWLERNPLQVCVSCPFCGERGQHRQEERCAYSLAALGSLFTELRAHGCRRWEIEKRRQTLHINRAFVKQINVR